MTTTTTDPMLAAFASLKGHLTAGLVDLGTIETTYTRFRVDYDKVIATLATYSGSDKTSIAIDTNNVKAAADAALRSRDSDGLQTAADWLRNIVMMLRGTSAPNPTPPAPAVDTKAIIAGFMEELTPHLATDKDGKVVKAAAQCDLDKLVEATKGNTDAITNHEGRIAALEKSSSFHWSRFFISLGIGGAVGIILGLILHIIGVSWTGAVGGMFIGAIIGAVVGVFIAGRSPKKSGNSN